MSAEIVVATSNRGKLREIRQVLAALPIRLVPASDFPGLVFPAEGDDYEANAIAKARTASEFCDRVAIADDSGLEVSGLGSAPGPRSARYGGPDLDDAGRVRALLAAMQGLRGEPRRARFVCVAALASPDGAIVTARGECAGRILDSAAGRGGFGYDPVFGVDARGVSMAELGEAEKNRISHRALAFAALSDAIRAWFDLPDA